MSSSLLDGMRYYTADELGIGRDKIYVEYALRGDARDRSDSRSRVSPAGVERAEKTEDRKRKRGSTEEENNDEYVPISAKKKKRKRKKNKNSKKRKKKDSKKKKKKKRKKKKGKKGKRREIEDENRSDSFSSSSSSSSSSSDFDEEDEQEIESTKYMYIERNHTASETVAASTLQTVMSKNELAARALRAKLAGNMEDYERLQKRLRNLQETVIVTPLDRLGRPIPDLATGKDAAIEQGDLRLGSRRGKQTLKDIERAAAMAIEGPASKMDTEFFVNDRLEKLTARRRQEIAIRRAVVAEKKWDAARSRCDRCIGTDAMKRREHLIVSVSSGAVLQLRASPLVPGHCRIAPSDHVGAMTEAEDTCCEHVIRYERALKRMIHSAGMGVIMMETVLKAVTLSSAAAHHTFIDVVPVPARVVASTPTFFKKALLEVGSEWSQHSKVIDVTGKELRHSIPRGFAYFHVRWSSPDRSIEGGFAHIIEDRRSFSHTFGMDVVSGMLGFDASRVHRGMSKQSRGRQQKAAADFSLRWSHFDWTLVDDKKGSVANGKGGGMHMRGASG